MFIWKDTHFRDIETQEITFRKCQGDIKYDAKLKSPTKRREIPVLF